MTLRSDSFHSDFTLASLVQHHQLGLVWLDVDLIIRQISDKAVELLGFPGRLVGMRISDILDELYGMDAILGEVVRRRRDSFSLELIEKENAAGRPYYISLSFYPYQPPDEPAGLLLVCEYERMGHLIRALNQQYVEIRLLCWEKQSGFLIDPLTGLGNHRDLEYMISGEAITALQTSRDLVVAVIHLEGQRALRIQSAESADALLRAFARALKSGFRQDGKIFRLGEDQFAILLSSPPEETLHHLHRRVQAAVERVRLKGFPDIEAQVGFAALSETSYDTREAIQLADLRIFAQKR
jgi:diguanylate cyclase (GGDEF)-like protein